MQYLATVTLSRGEVITCLVNSSQGLAARHKYDAYGNLVSQSGSLAGANVYRFSPKEWLATPGLYYYGYRWCAPNLQRWLSRDPIGERGGINLYGFVHNNPLRYVDPFGLKKFLCIYCNVCRPQGAGFTDGHSALILIDTDTPSSTTYGLWPDKHPGIVGAGLDNGKGSDVRVNYPGDDPSKYPYRHCRELTDKQAKKFEKLVSKNWKWRYTQNCSSFASDVFRKVTGVDIDANDLFGFETPREIGGSIIDANGGTESNESVTPIPPAPGPGGRSGSK